MFGTPSTPAFGTPSSTPAFGTPSPAPAFGTPSSTPAFGAPSSTPAFGALSSTSVFGSPSLFGTPSSTPAFGTPSLTPGFGSLSSGTPSLFGTPSSAPALGASMQSALFQTPQQQQNPSFGFQQHSFGFPSGQFTTQMAPITPISLSLPDREIQAILDAYKDDPGNPKYQFRHLLFSVMDPASRTKPLGVSDIMWAEAMAKLAGMDSVDRQRLWPQLVEGFKDLSNRLKLQDEVIASDTERLQVSQRNVKMLQRHYLADTLPWIQRMTHKEQKLQRRLLRVTRIVEALENRSFRVPLSRAEVQLSEKLAMIAKQLNGPGSDLSKKVHNLMSTFRLHPSISSDGSLYYLPDPSRTEDQSATNMLEVLNQQTEAIAKLGSSLKKDMRDVEMIAAAEGANAIEEGSKRRYVET